MSAFLAQRIKAREQKIEKFTRQIRELQRERREVEAELRAYLDVLNNGASDEASDESNKSAASEPEEADHTQPKNSRMSDTWKEILSGLYDIYPKPSHVDEIRSLVKSLGKEMSDESLRSQLSVYTKNGLLERTGTALYLITEAGSASIGKTLRKNAEEAEEDDFFN
jgi:predicted transcriptional regulator with HTH domain